MQETPERIDCAAAPNRRLRVIRDGNALAREKHPCEVIGGISRAPCGVSPSRARPDAVDVCARVLDQLLIIHFVASVSDFMGILA
jgi:hypothetical protein